jgi:hypothetical protein
MVRTLYFTSGIVNFRFKYDIKTLQIHRSVRGGSRPATGSRQLQIAAMHNICQRMKAKPLK